MLSRLPRVLSRLDLPEAELCAARLDGELYRVDECFSPVDEIEQATLRASALATILPARLIAEQLTAAWVLGALEAAPAVHQFCVSARARARPTASRRLSVREVEIDDAEIVSIAGIRVTTPLRTVVDLARFSGDFGAAEHGIVVGLLALGGLGFQECRAAIDARRNLPGKALALTRIRAALNAAGD